MARRSAARPRATSARRSAARPRATSARRAPSSPGPVGRGGNRAPGDLGAAGPILAEPDGTGEKQAPVARAGEPAGRPREGQADGADAIHRGAAVGHDAEQVARTRPAGAAHEALAEERRDAARGA